MFGIAVEAIAAPLYLLVSWHLIFAYPVKEWGLARAPNRSSSEPIDSDGDTDEFTKRKRDTVRGRYFLVTPIYRIGPHPAPPNVSKH